MTDVYIDDKYVGKVDDAFSFLEKVKQERRSKNIPSEMNLFFDDRFNEIYIDLTRGRNQRPLIVVSNGKSPFTPELLAQLENDEISWTSLVDCGVLEYLDAAEEENALVALHEDALTKEHTHLELDPLAMFGLITSLVPYSNYGQSSRLNIGSKAQKQGLGIYLVNYLMRIDTDVSILQHPQQPLVGTYIYRMAGLSTHPSGQNVVIALMSYEGYNMQDAI